MESTGHNERGDLVSIIIPLYNGERYIRETVESALNQDYSSKEVIVVDDGSTDQGPEIIKEYPVTLIRQGNKGIGGARNTGIKAARGAYIALLDQDDLMKPDKLSRQITYMQAHTGCVLVYTPEERFGEGETQRRISTRHRKRRLEGDLFTDLYRSNYIAPSSTLIRREVLERTGLFDETLPICEDHDLFIRIAFQGPIGFMETPLVEYRWHGDNTSRRRAMLMPGIELVLYRTYLTQLKSRTSWWWLIYNNQSAKALRDMGIGAYLQGNYRVAVPPLAHSLLRNPWRVKTMRFFVKTLLYLILHNGIEIRP